MKNRKAAFLTAGIILLGCGVIFANADVRTNKEKKDEKISTFEALSGTDEWQDGVILSACAGSDNCGTANGGNFSSYPFGSYTLCALSGPVISVVETAVGWNWNCGSYSCSANKTVDGSCGSASGTSSATAPTSNLCSQGNPSDFGCNEFNWTWSCSGAGGGNSVQCSANIQPAYNYSCSLNNNGKSCDDGGDGYVKSATCTRTPRCSSVQPVEVSLTECNSNGVDCRNKYQTCRGSVDFEEVIP